MPDPNLQSYLAAHYLSGPKADAILARSSDGKIKRNKKKPKTDDGASASTFSSGLVFKDDSDSWKTVGADEDEDGLTPQVVGQRDTDSSSKAFRKVGSSSTREPKDVASDAALTATMAAEEPTEFKAGLRTKEEMKAARFAREQRKAAQSTSNTAAPPRNDDGDDDDEEARLAQQTVYRDSSGRVIDMAAHEAEQQRLSRLEQQKAAERSTWSQGLIQKQQRQQASAQLASVAQQGIARRATDIDYNQHFKDQLREDDPALAFLTKKRAQGPQKPKYKGAWPPNRFNIAPGYRWDGVDRGNGYERAFFERKSVLARREQEARAWGQSDM
ncbi:related to BUD13-subunit of the RES complex, required for pre-mRNA retention and splicing [Sporisorium scitamineum]|uniref:Related to BUD13-subunit of the RES complex, required for pre-mRNA retention and splicing n=1 Tax=Sporisorium scitamineum TaxID=49012 RepID=A0A0F7S4L1_9BASI|nr:related to BUD13-subunit of the RES complex, required for pre-mRNA retention and splicing [Sporisorium scitamineum]CDW94490.1 hypothetical protein [Sporisorium scitamineum]